MQNTNHLSSASIVIVGAGPTGLAAANLLGLAGIETLVLERNAGLSEEAKAISIDDEGLRVCQAMGLETAMLEHVLLDLHAHYRSGRHYLAKIEPTSNRNGYPLISAFHQPTLEGLFLHGLKRFPHVTVYFQHTLESFEQHTDHVTLHIRTADGELLTRSCAYLLACDGGKSPIRHALGLTMQPLSTHTHTSNTQRWLVVDCMHDDDPTLTATFFCNPGRPAVTLPSPQQRRRWEFMLLPGEQEADLLQTETIHKLIEQGRAFLGIEQKTGAQITRKAIYTFHALLASSFAQERVFLLGDAAHLMPPFGGQGMNSGLRDAHNLCWKIALVVRGIASPHILSSYEQERSPHVAQMIRLSSFAGQVVMPTNHLRAMIRDILFATINRIGPAREALTEMRIKPHPGYKKGLLIAGKTRAEQALVGQFLPQPSIQTFDGQHTLLDNLLGNGFALLWLHDRAKQAFPTFDHAIWQRLSTRFIAMQPVDMQSVSTSVEGCTLVKDREGKLQDFLHNNPDLLILVRPDRYIMGVTPRAALPQFTHTLETILKGHLS